MIAGIQAEYQSDVGCTKDTTYLALTGELWDVFCEYFWENWQRYNSTTLYFHIPLPLTLESHGPLNRQLNWNSLPERSWNPPGLEHPSKTVDNSGITPNEKRNHHSGPQVLFLPETGLKKNLEPSLLLTHWLLWNLT